MSAPSPDPQNLVFGKYEVIRRLALGGMGEVFLARQTGGVSGTERLVILKSLLPELAEQEGFVDQFLDEARVAAKLNHPNIVQMFEAGAWNGIYFIAMEFIRGENLSKLMKMARALGKPAPVHLVVCIIRDALLGLAHAHGAHDEMTGLPLNVVHRDVSPQNIMVRADGVTKLVDFGIAKAANRLDRTKTGVLKGKLQFMSPEQVMGEDVDARTDQFAMGAVLWELLAGRRLFRGDSEIQILQAVVHQQIEPPSTVVPGLPAELEAVLMRMLERSRDQRYPSCAAAAADLSGWLTQSSRTVGEADVGVFVRDVLGSALEDVTKNLKASENFLISLHHTPSQVRPSRSPSAAEAASGQARPSRKLALALGIGGAVLLAGVGTATVLGLRSTATDVAPSTGATSTATAAKRPDVAPQISVSVAAAREGGTERWHIPVRPGATLLVDGTPAPTQPPAPLVLEEGPHDVRFRTADGVETVVKPVFPPPVVRILSEPAGATIFVGDRAYGVTPATLDGKLEGGLTHRLRLSLMGYESVELTLENLRNGETREVTESLSAIRRRSATAREPSSATTSSGVARLTVNIMPAAKVFVDGKLAGTTPLILPKLSAGKHTLVFEGATGQKKKVVVNLSAGEDKKLPLKWD